MLLAVNRTYHGYYEGRVANPGTAWLYDAELHVFQMGKIGSHSIAQALRGTYSGKVLHLHWVTDIAFSYPFCTLPYADLLLHERRTPVKVISGAREVVSRVLSGIFQYHGATVTSHDRAMELVEEVFWEQCDSVVSWFDHQYFCGLDIYAHQFDHHSGCLRIEHPKLDLFLYRQENLSRLDAQLARFLDLQAFNLARENVGGGKLYKRFYSKVIRDFRVPGNLLSKLYDTPYMRFFYSDEEREQNYARWVAT